MNGIWMDKTGVAHTVGLLGTVAVIPDGQTTFNTQDSATSELLHGAWGVDDGPRFAVGGSLNRNPPFTGVVVVDP